MADVVQLPGVLQQIRLVAGLRWIILKNSMRRKHNVWDLVGLIFVGFFSALLVLGLSFAFYAGAHAFMKTGFNLGFVLLFWGIFVWWQVLPVFAAGFGGNFEFKSLLRFPLSLRAFYLLGLGYGLSDFGALAAICWLMAMFVGVATAQPTAAPAFAGVALLFVVMNTTMERLIGSWVERLLAKRKTRELFLGLFILSMVSLNFLNPLIQRYGAPAKGKLTAVMDYVAWTPGSLAGNAFSGATSGDAARMAVGVAGLTAWVVGLSVLLRARFRAQYLGEEISESAAPRAEKRTERREQAGPEWPKFIPAPVLAVALKEMRYMLRNGFAFVTLIIPPAMSVFFSLQFAGRTSPLKEHALKPQQLFPAIMAYLILVLMSPAYNSFAFEGRGVQTYFLAPIRMQDVLRGKNLFLAMLLTVELILCILLLIWQLGMPGWATLGATIGAAAFAVTGQLTIANWSSLNFPRKMEIGKMRGQRNSGMAVWISFGVQIVLGTICALVYFAGGWTRQVWLPTFVFAALTLAAAGGYRASLAALDRLGEEKKELLIEALSK